MYMNFKRIFTAGLLCTFALSSCNDEMEYKEHTNYGKDYIELNFNNVGGLIADIYAKLDYDHGDFNGAMLASATDESQYTLESNGIYDFLNGSISPSNPKSTVWTNSYSGIQACNHYLEEFLGLTFPELQFNDDYNAQMFRYNNYENEVRFLRAYFYFNLVRQYGDVPFYTHAIQADEVNSLTRTSYKEIIEFIISECDAIIHKIPIDYSALGSVALPDVQDTGRATRLAVMALKARALLYAASPLFNTTNESDLWTKAAQANKALLDSCAQQGKTLNAYTAIWGTDNWTNNEAIFVRRIGALNNLEARNFPKGVEGGNGGNCPTQTLVDAYQMKETGKFWNEAGSGYDPENPYEGRDPRMNMTIVKNGDTKWPAYNTLPIQTFFGGVNGQPVAGATPTGYYLRKLLDPNVDFSSGKNTTTRHSWITYRLGEFYLNYAEAVFKALGTADATSSAFPMSAREAVNIVRGRTGVEMPELPVGMSNDEFWKQYTNERMVELAFEGHRFWDVRRWKEGDTFRTVVQMKITKNADDSFSYTRETVTRQWDDKLYFFPIPQSERMKNPNLTQNPGY